MWCIQNTHSLSFSIVLWLVPDLTSWIDIITQGKLPEVNVEPVQVFVHFMHNVLYYHPNQID